MGDNQRPLWLVGIRWFLFTVVAVVVAVVAVVVGLKERSALRLGRNVEVPVTFLGKTVLVTGATSGIGFATAVHLLKMGAHVIVHGPNEERTRKAAMDAHELAGGLGKATPLAASLDNNTAVRIMANTLMGLVPQVNVLLLNAAFTYGASPVFGEQFRKRMAAMKAEAFRSPTGQDKVLHINHYGHFLLTMLLRPKWASDVKIVIVTGNGMWQGDYRRIMYPFRYPWERNKEMAHLAYEDSKLANMCFGRAIQKHLGPSQYAVVHDPGQISTTMTIDRNSKAYKDKYYMYGKKDSRWVWWHMTAEQAAERLIRSAYVTRRPAPELVSSYWMPKELWRHRNHPFFLIQSNYWRKAWPVKFLQTQAFSFGPLYDIVGPGCGDKGLLDYFWNQSLLASGLSQYVDQDAYRAYYRAVLEPKLVQMPAYKVAVEVARSEGRIPNATVNATAS